MLKAVSPLFLIAGLVAATGTAQADNGRRDHRDYRNEVRHGDRGYGQDGYRHDGYRRDYRNDYRRPVVVVNNHDRSYRGWNRPYQQEQPNRRWVEGQWTIGADGFYVWVDGYWQDIAPAVVVAPQPGHVWIEGRWDWRYGRQTWVPGRWVRRH